jgi:Undecaprenyl-phosphate glucose phosphotransferase
MVTSTHAIAQRLNHAAFHRVRLSQSIVAGIAVLLDLLVICTTALTIYLVYVASTDPGRFPSYAGATGLYCLLLVQSFLVTGMYRFGRLIKPDSHVRRLMLIPVGIFLILLTLAFALKTSEEFSRVWAFAFLAALVVAIPAGRFALALGLGRLAQRGHLGRNILIYGAGEQGASLIRHIEAVGEPWNRIIGIFDDRGSRRAAPEARYPFLGGRDELLQWARTHRTDEILIALPWSATDRLLNITHILSSLPADVRLSPEFVGADFLHRRTSYQYGVPMLALLDKPVTGWSAIGKAVLDYSLGALFTFLCLPAMGMIALAIKLDSPGPVLFRQKRCGFNHQLIDVFKFRTMYVEKTDANADELTRPGDPRVTRVGAVLRRLSLDELPQLFNVLRGEMSLVGPRPHALKAKAGGVLYEDVIDDYAVRHKVKPGITGWAQVNGWRGNTETEADLLGRLEHDLYYIENWSVLFDFSIILRTAFVVLGGKNSY